MNQKPQKQGSFIAEQYYSGPIPSPENLAKYDEIHPGLAERIIQMAESESIHRREIEKRMTISYTKSAYMGMFFAFFSVCIVSFLVYYSIFKGFGKEAAYIAVGAIATVAGVFILFRRAAKKQ